MHEWKKKKKKQEVVVKSEEELTSGEIWGQVISLAYEEREFAFHALVGNIALWDRKPGEVIGITHDRSLIKCFKDCEYDKLAKHFMDELNYKSEFKLEYREKVYTKRERIDMRLTDFFKKFFDTDIEIEQRTCE